MVKRIGMVAAVALVWHVGAAQADSGCRFGGVGYSDGATTCQSGTQYRCNDGEWESLAIQCSPPDKSASMKSCDYNGETFSAGATSCQASTQYRCVDGAWQSLAIACSGPAPVAGDAPRAVPARTCMLDGTTVADSSTVCKAGVTFLCDDGAWRNLGTPCR